jgi:hypothetical protein
MKRCTIAFFLIVLIMSSVYSQVPSVSNEQDKDKPWKTLLIVKAVPVEADPIIAKNAASKMFSMLKDIGRINIAAAPSADKNTIPSDVRDFQKKYSAMGYERIIIATVREIKKKSANKLGEGADKYLLQISKGEYRINAEIICLDTGTRKKLSDSFTGETYAPSQNIFKASFSEFYTEREIIPVEIKEVEIKEVYEPVIRSVYLSSGLSLNIPGGSYRDYAAAGFGLHLEAGAENYYFPELHINLSADILKMSAKTEKLKPFYLFPVLITAGYEYDLSSSYSLLANIGAGMLCHSIAKSYYFDPLLSAGLQANYHLDTVSSFYISGSYYKFFDSYNKGWGISFSTGYTHYFNFSYTQDESFNIINLE